VRSWYAKSKTSDAQKVRNHSRPDFAHDVFARGKLSGYLTRPAILLQFGRRSSFHPSRGRALREFFAAHISRERLDSHVRYGDDTIIKEAPCGKAGGTRGKNVYTYKEGKRSGRGRRIHSSPAIFVSPSTTTATTIS